MTTMGVVHNFQGMMICRVMLGLFEVRAERIWTLDQC
jgi:hypothetical protein